MGKLSRGPFLAASAETLSWAGEWLALHVGKSSAESVVSPVAPGRWLVWGEEGERAG